jgi:hypothetical protein
MNPFKPAIAVGRIVTDGKLIDEAPPEEPGGNDKLKLTPAGFYIDVILPSPELRSVAISALNALQATPENEEAITHKLRRVANILNIAADEIEEIEAVHPKPKGSAANATGHRRQDAPPRSPLAPWMW